MHYSLRTLLLALALLGVGATIAVAAVSQGRAIVEVAEEQLEDMREVTERRAVNSASFAVEEAILDADARVNTVVTAQYEATPLAFDVTSTARVVAEHTLALGELRVDINEERDLQAILRAFYLDEDELRAMNPGVDLSKLEPGDTLKVYEYDPANPSVSRGAPNRGRLYNGVPMPESEHWIVRDHAESWGTEHAVAHIVRGLTATGEAFPDSPRPMIGDLSRVWGGHFPPHRSHQSGRDVDIMYYHREAARSEQFTPTSRHSLDVERQWFLFRYWIERELVEYIFVDTRLIYALHQYAESIGEDPDILIAAFGDSPYPGDGLIRYSPGHDDHFHARFVCAPTDSACRER